MHLEKKGEENCQQLTPASRLTFTIVLLNGQGLYLFGLVESTRLGR